MDRYFWGTPLEDLSRMTTFQMVFGDPDSAYLYARNLAHSFFRVNTEFWMDDRHG